MTFSEAIAAVELKLEELGLRDKNGRKYVADELCAKINFYFDDAWIKLIEEHMAGRITPDALAEAGKEYARQLGLRFQRRRVMRRLIELDQGVRSSTIAPDDSEAYAPEDLAKKYPGALGVYAGRPWYTPEEFLERINTARAIERGTK